MAEGNFGSAALAPPPGEIPGIESNLAINVAPVANVEHRDTLLLVIDFVDDAVISHAEPPALARRQLLASGGTWGLCQSSDGVSDALEGFGRKRAELPLSTP
jgi:hypothetical protein